MEGRCRKSCIQKSKKRLKESEGLSTRAMKKLNEKQRTIQPFLLLVVFVFVFLFRRFHSQGRQGHRLHACVRKIRRIRWIRRDESQTFRTRAAEVSSTAVMRGLDRFLITPWNVCQNPSCYKKRAWLAQGWRIEQGKKFPLLLQALVMPPCSDRPIKCSLSGVETAQSCRPGSRGLCLRRRWK